MNNYAVNICFLDIENFKTEVLAINELQAMFQSLFLHREITCCGLDELYNATKSTVTLIKSEECENE